MAMAHGGQTLLSADARQALAAPPIPDADLHGHGHYRLKGYRRAGGGIRARLAARCSFTPPADVEKSYRVVRADGLWQPVREIAICRPSATPSSAARSRPPRRSRGSSTAARACPRCSAPAAAARPGSRSRHGRGGSATGPAVSGSSTCRTRCRRMRCTTPSRASSACAWAAATQRRNSARRSPGRGRCLIVLDNFEQLVPHAVATVGPGSNAPRNRLVVTSRERLPARRAVQPVGPLPLDGRRSVLPRHARARCSPASFRHGAARRRRRSRRAARRPAARNQLAAARYHPCSRRRNCWRGWAIASGCSPGGHGGRQATLRATIDWSWQLLAAGSRPRWSSARRSMAVHARRGRGGDRPVGMVRGAAGDRRGAGAGRQRACSGAGCRPTPDAPRPGGAVLRHVPSIPRYAAEKCRLRGDADYRALQERHGRCHAAFGSDEAIEALSLRGGTQRRRAAAGTRQPDRRVPPCCRSRRRRGRGRLLPSGLGSPRAAGTVRRRGVAGRSGSARWTASTCPRRRKRSGCRLPTRWCVGATEAMEARLAAGLSACARSATASSEGHIVGRLGNLCLWGDRLEAGRTAPRRSRASATSATGSSGPHARQSAIVAHERIRPGRAGVGVVRAGAGDRARDR